MNQLSPEDQALAATARIMQRLKARPLAYLTGAGKTQIETLRLRFRQGQLKEPELQEGLVKLGMPKEQVDAILDYELTRKGGS